MGNVVDINANKPHMSGQAKCLNCGHKWVAVAPCGVTELECNKCKTMKGIFVKLVADHANKRSWQCNCGNWYFAIVESGVPMCIVCGQLQEGCWND